MHARGDAEHHGARCRDHTLTPEEEAAGLAGGLSAKHNPDLREVRSTSRS